MKWGRRLVFKWGRLWWGRQRHVWPGVVRGGVWFVMSHDEYRAFGGRYRPDRRIVR